MVVKNSPASKTMVTALSKQAISSKKEQRRAIKITL